jgi:hypothetical protein
MPSIMQWWTLSLDHPDLPHRLGAIQSLAEDPARHLPELCLRARVGKGDVADVIGRIEVGVVDPHRMTLDGDPLQPLAVPRHVLEPGLDEPADRVDVDAAFRPGQIPRLEHQRPPDMHGVRRALHREEGVIEEREPLVVGHATEGRSGRG